MFQDHDSWRCPRRQPCKCRLYTCFTYRDSIEGLTSRPHPRLILVIKFSPGIVGTWAHMFAASCGAIWITCEDGGWCLYPVIRTLTLVIYANGSNPDLKSVTLRRRHMTSGNLVNISLGYHILPEGTKLLSELMMADLWVIECSGTNFGKFCYKMTSAKLRQFCSGLNVLTHRLKTKISTNSEKVFTCWHQMTIEHFSKQGPVNLYIRMYRI